MGVHDGPEYAIDLWVSCFFAHDGDRAFIHETLENFAEHKDSLLNNNFGCNYS